MFSFSLPIAPPSVETLVGLASASEVIAARLVVHRKTGDLPCGARALSRRDHPAHDAVVLALGPQIREAVLLVEAARRVVEELRRDLLALRVLRVALDHPAACLRDQVDRTPKGDTGDAFPSIVAVDEDARESVVGQRLRTIRLVVLPVMNVRELVRRAELTPGDGLIPVEDERRMRGPLPDEA